MQNVVPSPAVWAVPSSPVPEHVRNFIISNYGISPDANMYINYEEPNKVYVIYNGYLQYVDFASPSPCSPSIINNMPTNSPTLFPNQPVFTYAENFSAPTHIAATPPIQYTNPPIPVRPVELAKPSSGSELLRNRRLRLEKQNDIQLQRLGKSDNGHPYKKTLQIFSSEWHKLTDSEREAIQRERRKANAYKTALCQSYKDTGTCEYGDECCFAHGESELRLPPQAHPKYKTQLCNKFSVNGYCPYGSRCQFIHQRPSDNSISKVGQQNSRKTNFAGVFRGELRNGARLSSKDPDVDKSACMPSKFNTAANLGSAHRKKKSNSSAGSGSGEKAANFHPWNGVDESKSFTPDVLQAQSTPLASRISNNQKMKVAAPASREKSDISSMLEKLFVNETDVAFSQSCFPRLTMSPGWLAGVK